MGALAVGGAWSSVLFVPFVVLVAMMIGLDLLEHDGVLGAGLIDMDRLHWDPAFAVPDKLISPRSMAWSTALQFFLMVLATLPVAWLVALVRRKWLDQPESVRGVLGLRRASLPQLAVAVLFGLTASGTSSAMMSLIPEAVTENLDDSSMVAIGESLTAGTGLSWVVMVLGLTVGAPVIEELVFRGLGWNLLERWLPVAVPWLVTSVAFALIHMSGLHILGIVPHAIVLGLMRWTSKSLWPPMLLHFVNNTLAVVLALALDVDEFPVLLSWSMAVVFLALIPAAVWTRTREGQPGAR